MDSIAPVKLYGHQDAPNPWKIVLILKELDVPFEHIYMKFPDMKTESYLKLNPHGRVPVLEDPNTGIVVWESGAIAEYVVDTYDYETKLTYTTAPEKWALKTWEHFQVSVHDLYCGQQAYFTRYHPNKNLPTVTEYFGNEVLRALGVIELHLKRTAQPYLVGEKCTFVDLMYIPFNSVLGKVIFNEDFDAKWKADMPACYDWHRRLMEREKVKEVLAVKTKATETMYADRDRLVGPYGVSYNALPKPR